LIADNILGCIGGTPVLALKDALPIPLKIFAKLEGFNPTGSIKDRAAYHLISCLLKEGRITPTTPILESSSGSYGASLAMVCRHFGLSFFCVIDPLVSVANASMIRLMGATIHMVEGDPTKYLETRLAKIRELLWEQGGRGYWTNQYENPLSAEAYYLGLGEELCREFSRIDYLFVAVSSGGTITGLSKRVKERFPGSKVIAVDVEGSQIFHKGTQRRIIPGIGSARFPPILEQAEIDGTEIVSQCDIIRGCRLLIQKHGILAGGSSGAVYHAILKHFSGREGGEGKNIVALLPDHGGKYLDTIFSDDWVGLQGLASGIPSAPSVRGICIT
jgi:N-(2-amino-2-carboxyethyl)-L-glutamate synthase